MDRVLLHKFRRHRDLAYLVPKREHGTAHTSRCLVGAPRKITSVDTHEAYSGKAGAHVQVVYAAAVTVNTGQHLVGMTNVLARDDD